MLFMFSKKLEDMIVYSINKKQKHGAKHEIHGKHGCR